MAESIGLLNQHTLFVYHGFESHSFQIIVGLFKGLDSSVGRAKD